MTSLTVTLRLGQKVKVHVTLCSTCNDEGFTSVISCNIYYALKPYTWYVLTVHFTLSFWLTSLIVHLILIRVFWLVVVPILVIWLLLSPPQLPDRHKYGLIKSFLDYKKILNTLAFMHHQNRHLCPIDSDDSSPGMCNLCYLSLTNVCFSANTWCFSMPEFWLTF